MNNLKRTNIYNARSSIISSENLITKLRDFVIIEIVQDFFRNLRILLLFPYFDKARSIFLRNRYGGERGGGGGRGMKRVKRRKISAEYASTGFPAGRVIPSVSEKCYLRRVGASYRSSVLIYMW